MFKKSAEAKSLQRLSGADRKKLRRTMKDRFPLASDADIDIIFPAKVEITVTKYHNRAHVYGVESGPPMLFDVDGRGSELFPTVYALWNVPHLLPSFELKGGEVSRFILGGADLMFPGISIPPEGLPPFLEGQPWAIKVPGNPAPIAVGSTTMSSGQAIKAGLRGKALRVTHYYRDSLWESAEGRYVPNPGFLEDIVVGDPASSSELAQKHEEQTEQEDRGTELPQNDEEEPQLRDDGGSPVLPLASVSHDVDSSLAVMNISEGQCSEDKDQRSLSTEEVDALLDKCLLQALHTSVKDKDLPMPGSTLWSGHVLPCRPSGMTLDIKKSSYKKLSKWLQSKASAGLISAKEDKHKKEMILQSVNQSHVDYSSFRPEKRDTVAVTVAAAVRSSSDSQVTGLSLDVVEVFKPTSHVTPIFVAVGANPTEFYTAAEATDIVFRYVEEGGLTKAGDKAVITLDATLCDSLYKGAIKKGERYPSEVHKREVGPLFLARMQVHHSVTRGPDTAVRKGPARPVQIISERRQGNKKVTRFSGLETFLIDADTVAAELQKKFACSTSVTELPGKKGQSEVLVQGGVIEDLARHLVEHYGIPKRFIEVLDKTKR
ncbi:eukaryotic translation initiation factor SUI1 family protein isoform X2 [Wolffia australiana]